jgi:hypothetical protein
MSTIDWGGFDHHSAGWMADPALTYADARACCPVARSEQHGGFWLVTRYSDVDAVARDWAHYSSASVPSRHKRWRPASGCSSPTGRPTAIQRSSPRQMTLTSSAPTTATSPSARASTAVSAVTWPGWNFESPFESSSTGFPTTKSPDR